MKHHIALTKHLIALCAVLLLVSCGESAQLRQLKEKYPEYFEMSDFKGIEVYVWQMAENSYRCGMLGGTNRLKTQEEIWGLQSRSLSIDEAKLILDELGVEDENVFIIPISQPISSYYYDELDEGYRESVRKLFD